MSRNERKLFDCFNRHMLSPRDIVEQAVAFTLSGAPPVDVIKRDFSKYVMGAEEEAYRIFLEAQKPAWVNGINDYIIQLGGPDHQAAKARFLSDNFTELDSFFLSLSQSRRVRAGGAFQSIIKYLFRRLDYPFSEEPIINGQPDFLLPNVEYYREFPVDCIIFTVKRTLRERWRQIVTEGTRGQSFHLATIDNSITVNQLGEMAANRIYLVVPDAIKNNTRNYRAAVNVMSFESFFEDILDVKMRAWRKKGVV
jgi:hypothetical protein